MYTLLASGTSNTIPWSGYPSSLSLSPHASRGGRRGRNYENCIIVKIAVPKIVESFQGNTRGGVLFNKIVKWRHVTLLKTVFHYVFFPSNFLKFAEQLLCYPRTDASVYICILIFVYLHILPINFYINHSQSHNCSHVHVIIEIFNIILLLLLCLMCRYEVM